MEKPLQSVRSLPFNAGAIERSIRTFLILAFILSVNSVTTAAGGPPTRSWITTNALGAPALTNGYLSDLDLTPSVTTNVPNSTLYHNDAFRLSLRLKEPSVLRAEASATYGGRIMASYDIRAMDTPVTTPATQEEMGTAWRTNRTLLKANYFRGRLYLAGGYVPSDEWLTVFTSEHADRIVTVYDSGPISVSENGGSAWSMIVRPATYEFTLSTTPKGSALVAVVSLTQEYANAAARALPKVKRENWYCAASAADGSQVVLSGGPSQSAPALCIARFGNQIRLTWPSAVANFVLQQCNDLSAANWTDVTARVESVGAENQVILPFSDGRTFFRLKRQ